MKKDDFRAARRKARIEIGSSGAICLVSNPMIAGTFVSRALASYLAGREGGTIIGATDHLGVRRAYTFDAAYRTYRLAGPRGRLPRNQLPLPANGKTAQFAFRRSK